MHYQKVLRRQDAEDTDAERVAPAMTTPAPPTGVSQTTGGTHVHLECGAHLVCGHKKNA